MEKPRVTRTVPTKAQLAKKKARQKPKVEVEVPSVDREGFSDTGVRVITEMDPDYQPVRHRAGRPDVVSPEMDAVLEKMISNGQESVQLIAGLPFTIYQIRNWADKINRGGDLPDHIERVRVAYRQDTKRITVILAKKS